MAEIINLNRVRKVKAREERSAQAEVNRAKFGRTKGEKAADSLEAERREHLLDGTKLDD